MSSAGNASYQWMARLLDLLFARYDRNEALQLLRDLDARDRAMAALAPELEAAAMPPGMRSSAEGQNLFVAVLSLRLKFSVDEAHEKVALNIAMREGRRQ